MVGPNTMMASSQWIKRNMLGVYSEELGRPLTDAEMRVQRCLEKLQVPDWYLKYSKPLTKFLKNHTPIECRPPTWKTMKGKSTPRTPNKSRAPKKEESPAKSHTTVKKSLSPRKSLNSNYRIIRKADSVSRAKDRLSISITPTSSDNESEQAKKKKKKKKNSGGNSNDDYEEITLMNASKSLRSPLNASNTFPRMHSSRKIQNINIVFPAEFTPKAPRRRLAAIEVEGKPESSSDEAENNESMVSSTPRTVYTLTKNIELNESEAEDCNDSTSQRNHTSFLFAEVEPCGVTTTVQVFAGMDSGESDEHEAEREQVPDRSSPSPHTRFFNSQKKSSELERIVQRSTQQKRGNSLIREIIDELDRSIAESRPSQQQQQQQQQQPQQQTDSFIGSNNNSQEFVKGMVRALESSYVEEEEDDYERSYGDDSELAKSTSISFKSYGDAVSSSRATSDDERDQETTPLPTCNDYRNNQEEQQDEDEEKEEEVEEKEEEEAKEKEGEVEEEEQEEVYWIPSKIHDLARTSSRLSMMSRGSSRSGFQCTSGRCSPGLSPIRSDRPRDEWTATLTSHRSQKISRQLFRIDETGVADSGCYSDRSGATSQSRSPDFNERDNALSPLPPLSSSPTILPTEFGTITTDMLMQIAGSYPRLKSVRV